MQAKPLILLSGVRSAREKGNTTDLRKGLNNLLDFIQRKRCKRIDISSVKKSFHTLMDMTEQVLLSFATSASCFDDPLWHSVLLFMSWHTVPCAMHTLLQVLSATKNQSDVSPPKTSSSIEVPLFSVPSVFDNDKDLEEHLCIASVRAFIHDFTYPSAMSCPNMRKAHALREYWDIAQSGLEYLAELSPFDKAILARPETEHALAATDEAVKNFMNTHDCLHRLKTALTSLRSKLLLCDSSGAARAIVYQVFYMGVAYNSPHHLRQVCYCFAHTLQADVCTQPEDHRPIVRST